MCVTEDCRRHLLARRNPDYGWGYYPRQSSWLEPTAFAALALQGTPESDRALELLRGWQLPSGAWPAHPATGVESWATSLVLVVKALRTEFDSAFRHGLAWLLSVRGATNPLQPWVTRFTGLQPEVIQDPTLYGWPWSGATASWVEPTAHALRALRLARSASRSRELVRRIDMGGRLILDRRCRDAGWNYGNKKVLGHELESFPECTALALIGLCGAGLDLAPSAARALADWKETPTPYAAALIRIALRMHNIPFEDRPLPATLNSETTYLALALIGEPEGAWRGWKGAAA